VSIAVNALRTCDAADQDCTSELLVSAEVAAPLLLHQPLQAAAQCCSFASADADFPAQAGAPVHVVPPAVASDAQLKQLRAAVLRAAV